MTALTETFTRRCLEAGFRVTEPRRAIIELLATTDDHPTTEDIHWRLRDKGHAISLATVYRTMRLMEELGLLDRHQFNGGNMRYEMAAEESHDHLIDIEDSNIIEFTDPEIEKLLSAIADRLGYSLVDHRLELYGKKSRKEI
ncbi:MAG: Fur family transcriptional regulator [Pseudomonadota bacterium]